MSEKYNAQTLVKPQVGMRVRYGFRRQAPKRKEGGLCRISQKCLVRASQHNICFYHVWGCLSTKTTDGVAESFSSRTCPLGTPNYPLLQVERRAPELTARGFTKTSTTIKLKTFFPEIGTSFSNVLDL